MQSLLPKPGDQGPLRVPVPTKRSKTLAACEECRKRKVKCDGSRPRCRQCERVKSDHCRYAIAAGLSHRDVKNVQLQRSAGMRTVLKLLRSSSPGTTLDLLRKIRNASTLDDAITSISDTDQLLSLTSPEGSELHPGSEIPFSGPSLEPIGHPSETPPRAAITDLSDNTSNPVWAAPDFLPVSRWTEVSDNNALLNHGMRLFWDRDLIASNIIDRETFLEDLQSAQLGYCSDVLVNAIVALGCLHCRPNVCPCIIRISNVDREAFALSATAGLETMMPQVSSSGQGLVLAVKALQGATLLWIYATSSNCEKINADHILKHTDYLRDILQIHETVPPNAFHLSLVGPPWSRALKYLKWGLYMLDMKMALISPRGSLNLRVATPPLDPISSSGQAKLEDELYGLECALVRVLDGVIPHITWVDQEWRAVISSRHDLSSLLDETYNRVRIWWASSSVPEYVRSRTLGVPRVLALQSDFHLTALALIKSREAIASDGHDIKTATECCFLAENHAILIVSILWSYHTEHSLRHEWWMAWTCYAAAAALIPRSHDDEAEVEYSRSPRRANSSSSFVAACRLLYSLGTCVPQANTFLLRILRASARQGDQGWLRSFYSIMYPAILPRIRSVIIRNAQVFHPPPTLSLAGEVAQHRDSLRQDRRYDVKFSYDLDYVAESQNPTRIRVDDLIS